MGRYNELMLKVGVFVVGEGLMDVVEGFVVDFSVDKFFIMDGFYGEMKEFFNGFWIFEVFFWEEVVEWVSCVFFGFGFFFEVCCVIGVEDFFVDNEWI